MTETLAPQYRDLFNQSDEHTPKTLATEAPINAIRLGGQNFRLIIYLLEGKHIHTFHEDKRFLRIGFLNSRVSDLINVHKIAIEKKRIKAPDLDGAMVDCIEYYMLPDEIKRVKPLVLKLIDS